MKVALTIIFLIIAGTCGCMKTRVWEKPGGSQQLFNLDSRECEFLAEDVALQQSETGNKVEPVLFNQVYFQCLAAKGWNQKLDAAVPKDQKESLSVPQLAEIIGTNSMSGLGQVITLPETFNLAENKKFQIGPTIIQQLFWKGDNVTFVNILFQQNKATAFDRIPYPVSESYLFYDSGIGNKAGQRLRWTCFYGKIDTEWIMGIGAYYYVSDKERIIIVITRPLSQPDGTPPENVTLTRNQFLEIEQFSNQWQHWLNQQFQQGPGFLNKLKDLLRFEI